MSQVRELQEFLKDSQTLMEYGYGEAMESVKVLMAEDDPSVRKAVQRVLELEKYSVTAVNDGRQALEVLEQGKFDLIVLDVMMPFADGLTVCRESRHRGITTPILLLTARHEVGDRVAGLDAGADDYLVKPIDPPELMARIRALSRRAQIAEPTVLRWGELQLDPGMHEVSYAGQSVHLTPKEYNILELLLHHGRQVLKRITIVEHVWSLTDPPREDTINATIKSLRNKLKGAAAPHNLIETIHGVGYRLSQLS